MTCPFPGMDPFIERPAIWPDFHDALITFIRSALQPLLRPKYLAVGGDRLYVVESDRPIRPDLAVVSAPRPHHAEAPAVAVLEPDVPAVFELWREEIREPVIHIIEPAAGNRIVTAIEVLSPTNKEPGPGRKSYLDKREEYWASGTSLVEIDLLHEGEPTLRVSAEKIATLGPWRYLVAVTRRWPSRQEVYAVPLQRRLPRVNIPLASEDKDVVLDLQAVFTRCYEEGPYPELLRYDHPPPGPLSQDEVQWCRQQLSAAGIGVKQP